MRTRLMVLTFVAIVTLAVGNPSMLRGQSDSLLFPVRHGWFAIGGLHLGGISRVAAALGVGPGVRTVDAGAGYAVVGEGGIGGGQVSLAAYNRGPALGGYRIQISLLRTWGEPNWVGPDQTFVGLEAQLVLFGFGPRIGYFRRIRGDIEGDSGVWSVGVALGM